MTSTSDRLTAAHHAKDLADIRLSNAARSVAELAAEGTTYGPVWVDTLHTYTRARDNHRNAACAVLSAYAQWDRETNAEYAREQDTSA